MGTSKFIVTVSGNIWYLPQYIFDHYNIGDDEVPRKDNKKYIERWVEGG